MRPAKRTTILLLNKNSEGKLDCLRGVYIYNINLFSTVDMISAVEAAADKEPRYIQNEWVRQGKSWTIWTRQPGVVWHI